MFCMNLPADIIGVGSRFKVNGESASKGEAVRVTFFRVSINMSVSLD